MLCSTHHALMMLGDNEGIVMELEEEAVASSPEDNDGEVTGNF